MAKQSVQDWDANADNNTDIGGTFIGEGWAGADINNAIRKIMSQLATLIGGGEATAATIYAALAHNAFISPANLFAAAAPVALADGNMVTPQNGISFALTLGALTSGTRTLANPVGFMPGQNGVISLKQDATGNRLITTYGSAYDFGAAGTPVLSTAANRVDKISYYVDSIAPLHLTCTFVYGFNG